MISELFLTCDMTCSWWVTSSGWAVRCMSANLANSAVHPLGVFKWVVNWNQAFAINICVVAPPGECLRVKADMVLFAGKCDPYLSALEAFAKMRYTNRRYLPIWIQLLFCWSLWTVMFAVAGNVCFRLISHSVCTVWSWPDEHCFVQGNLVKRQRWPMIHYQCWSRCPLPQLLTWKLMKM